MSKQTTKPGQFETMLEYLEANKEIAVGYVRSLDGRVKCNRLWERLSTMLTAEGPPIRKAVQWKKVWADYKTHLKAKLRKNTTSISGTGGGPSLK